MLWVSAPGPFPSAMKPPPNVILHHQSPSQLCREGAKAPRGAAIVPCHPQGTEPGLKRRVCVRNCRPATSENLLYTKHCTNKAHVTLLMPFSDGIPVSFWRTRENEAKTGMGQARVTRLRGWLSFQMVDGELSCLSHHPLKCFCCFFFLLNPHKGASLVAQW